MNSKLQKAIEQYEYYAVRKKELEQKQEKRRAYISSYVLKNGKVEYNGVTCYPTSRVKISYDIEEIKARFKRKLLKRFLDDVVQFDTSFFVSRCEELGIDKKEFMQKNKFTRTVSVNEKKLQKLTDSGEITFKQLKGCYTSEESTSVTIRLG